MTFSVCLTGASGDRWTDNWSFVLSHWPPDMIYLIGGPDPRVPDYFRGRWEEIFDATELPDLPLVVMSPENARFVPGTVSIVDFVHPAECVYLFGSDHVHLSEVELGERRPDHVVYIPTGSIHEMYSHTAGAVTLYDRMMKNG